MTEEIRKNAEALMERRNTTDENYNICHIKKWHVYTQLKASLRPSREEIADYLEGIKKWMINNKGVQSNSDFPKNMDYAIEELRK